MLYPYNNYIICLHHANSYKKSLTMSILKYLVILNHGILHVVTWVKTKQLTTGYIQLKCIQLFSYACIFCPREKESKASTRHFSPNLAALKTSNRHESFFQFITSYHWLTIDDLQNNILSLYNLFKYLNERKITIFLEICLMAMNIDLKIVRFLCDVNGSVNKNNSSSI